MQIVYIGASLGSQMYGMSSCMPTFCIIDEFQNGNKFKICEAFAFVLNFFQK